MVPYPDPNYLFDSPFFGHHEASPKPDLSSSFFPFSPPTFGQNDFHHLLLTAQPLPIDVPVRSPADPAANKDTTKSIGRKRGIRKDRHSKIITAQGQRDRRMRLSLEVARDFFDLQDMLGFDKASKTVEWLLAKSKTAIKDLSRDAISKGQIFIGSSLYSESSTSECEVVSRISNCKETTSAAPAVVVNTLRKATRSAHHRLRKPASHPTLVRESRAKARARARERTREKKRMLGGMLEDGDKPNQLASSPRPLNSTEEDLGSHSFDSSLELVVEVEELDPPSPNQCNSPVHGQVNDCLPMYSYHQNIISNNDSVNFLQEQWDVQISENIEEQRVILAGDVIF